MRILETCRCRIIGASGPRSRGRVASSTMIRELTLLVEDDEGWEGKGGGEIGQGFLKEQT